MTLFIMDKNTIYYHSNLETGTLFTAAAIIE